MAVKSVANRSQSQANHRRILGAVDYLIDFSRLETTLQINESGIRDQLALNQPGELPVLARNDAPLAQDGIAHGQLVIRAAWIDRRLGILPPDAQAKQYKFEQETRSRSGQAL